MKSSILFMIFLVLSSSAQAQIVSKDSVSFSEDFTKTTLFLEFNQALSQDTVYSSGLPFTFVFMAPLDSISIHAVNKNEANTAYTIEFNTQPNTYYSLLSLDVKTASDNDWHSFSMNFLVGSAAKIDTARLQFYSYIVKASNYKQIEYNPTLTTLVLKPSTFINLVNTFQKNEIDNVLEYPFGNGLLSSSTYHFKYQNEHSPGAYRNIYQDLFASESDTVMIFSFFSGRNSTNKDSLSSPQPLLDYSRGSYFFIIDFADPLDSFPKYFKPIKEYDKYSISVVLNTSIEINTNVKPSFFTLHSAFPNPFNPSTTLSFSVSEPSQISFSVFDVLGRKVQEINSSELLYSAGNHQQIFDFSRLASGMYVIEANGVSLSSGLVSKQTIKVSLVK